MSSKATTVYMAQVKRITQLRRSLKVNYDLYLLLIPSVLYFVIFKYLPMYGVQIAFRDFVPTLGIVDSPFVGMKHFLRFVNGPQFTRLIANTVSISFYSLIFGFPAPIILALMMNDVSRKWFKKTVQLVTYAPNFISMVVMVGMIIVFLSPSYGIVNKLLNIFGIDSIDFMAKDDMFRGVYIVSGIWQRTGWNSIIYLAALTGISTELYEAATIDGASKLQKTRYITLPGIAPTIIILLILNVGQIMSVGFEKVFLMQNALNLSKSEVISTYVYKVGLLGTQFSFSAAVGLFNSAINFALLVFVNQIAKKLGDTSLW